MLRDGEEKQANASRLTKERGPTSGASFTARIIRIQTKYLTFNPLAVDWLLQLGDLVGEAVRGA